MPRLEHGRLLTIATAILEGAGAPRTHAAIVADHLVTSNLQGHDSHGILRLSQYCEAIEQKEVDPRARPTVRKESVAGAVLDGQRGFGQVAAREAMVLAMERARLVGVSAVTLSNCYHSGRLSAYSLMASQAGMIGVVMVNAGGGGQSVAPFGGLARRLATNPIAIAVPSGGDYDPVLDVATSMAPEGKIRDYFRRGEPVPDGWIVDAHGFPTRHAKDFYGPPAGALLPWGGPVGHKGYGLALMIDVMAGALSGAGCCGPAQVPPRDGVLLLAIDVEQYTDSEWFRAQVVQLIDHVKSCPPAPGYEEVFVPGELEHREAQKRRRTGIPVDDTTWEEMHSLARRFRLPPEMFDAAHDGWASAAAQIVDHAST
ncbi:MAG: Ldh family oxidoreductase [Pirellulales bacterium]|nr:Ldh family oxidoreductase [Pirellulales bacterium]